MKTPLFFIAAFFTLPVDFTVLISALFAAGLLTILINDYRRSYRPLKRAAVLSMQPAPQTERFRLAA